MKLPAVRARRPLKLRVLFLVLAPWATLVSAVAKATAGDVPVLALRPAATAVAEARAQASRPDREQPLRQRPSLLRPRAQRTGHSKAGWEKLSLTARSAPCKSFCVGSSMCTTEECTGCGYCQPFTSTTTEVVIPVTSTTITPGPPICNDYCGAMGKDYKCTLRGQCDACAECLPTSPTTSTTLRIVTLTTTTLYHGEPLCLGWCAAMGSQTCSHMQCQGCKRCGGDDVPTPSKGADSGPADQTQSTTTEYKGNGCEDYCASLGPMKCQTKQCLGCKGCPGAP